MRTAFAEFESRRRQRGTSMVEMALVLPLILLLLLGTLEFGLIFARYQLLLASARNGARVASLLRDPCTPGAVKGQVDLAVMSNGNQLGMLLLPTNVELTGACVKGGASTVTVRYNHYLTMLGGSPNFDFMIPLEAKVVMLNEFR